MKRVMGGADNGPIDNVEGYGGADGVMWSGLGGDGEIELEVWGADGVQRRAP